MKKLLIVKLTLLIPLVLVACQSDKVNLGSFPIGTVDQCQTYPIFIKHTQLGRSTAIDSRQQGFTGLRLIDIRTGKVWRHKSWDDAGYIGAFERDRWGNIYVAPVPEVSLKKNPPGLQNRIYKIDTNTAEMSLFIELPRSKPATPTNPFGVMGLSYDCNTDSLYASSVADSSPTEELGHIYQIDVRQKKIISQQEHTDSIGIGVFNSKNKRLYYGSARNSHIFSIRLDAQGRFINDKPRYELSLTHLEGGNSTNVKKIRFKQKNNDYLMIVKEIAFGFRLSAGNNPYRNVYYFKYNQDDKWDYLGAKQE